MLFILDLQLQKVEFDWLNLRYMFVIDLGILVFFGEKGFCLNSFCLLYFFLGVWEREFLGIVYVS